jgi:hypothetical protein
VFAVGITEAMITQVKALQEMGAALLKGSGAVSAKQE